MVKLLLSHSADCNTGFYNSHAIRDGLREVEKSTGDFEHKQKEKWMQWFTTNCVSSVVEYISQEPNTVMNTLGGATPLHLMCFSNNIDMIKLLLERKPDINIRKEDGSTPLFVACMFGFVDIATVLLEHGDKIDIRRNDRARPLEMAKFRNHTAIVSLLENPKWKTWRMYCAII